MTPLDILAAARRNQVGPYVPAKEGWLKGWTGPVELLCQPEDTCPFDSLEGWEDTVWSRWRVLHPDGNRWFHLGARDYTIRLRLDTRRPEVRHLLCDLGVAPEWARKSAVACWCAGMIGLVRTAGPWVGLPIGSPEPKWCERRAPGSDRPTARADVNGWAVGNDSGEVVVYGPETGDLGRACADLAALRAGCILEEADGWYVPLVDGGFGWWARETP